MLSNESLKEILALAVHAPSGDNSQPWEFKISQGTISIFNLPERDSTLYNFHQQGSYLAHGAVVENIVIASSHFGYSSHVQPFPGENNCTAHVTFIPTRLIEDVLYSAIEKRSTNRKLYKIVQLQSEDRIAIEESILNIPGTSLLILEDRKKIGQLARAISSNERLLMENRHLHDFLFSMIRWTRDAESQKPGLYIDTMELPPPVRFLFRYILCRWPLVRLLNLLGFSRLLPKQTASIYQACSAICAIVIKNLDKTSFLNAGRALQRLWLTVTHRGLSLQPITAIPYLARRVQAGEANAFLKKHVDLIRQEHTKIIATFGLTSDEGHIAIIFRVGYGDLPSAYSAKLSPVIRRGV